MQDEIKITDKKRNLQFLAGGGEMGDLIRSKDWESSSLGGPDKWPQSLRSTLSILLNSGFPMVLFWGPDLVCFYNDAFRPSLGEEGKHPMILGMKGEQAWNEIWDTIKPWIDSVLLENKAIWNEDLLVPIFRNGKIEEVYWTFSYSAVNDETDKPAGVFVAVVETTEKVKNLKRIAESERRFRAMADNIPNLAWMADPDGWIFWYNRKWYEYTGTIPEEMEGWGWQSVHDPAKLPSVLEKWTSSIANGEPFEMIFPLRGSDGKFKQFLTRVLPVHDKNGNIEQWFGTNTDITLQIEAEQFLKESEERFRIMAEASDILIAVGDETSNATYFNKAWVNLTGRPVEDLISFGWVDLLHPEDKENYINIYLSAFEKKLPFKGEFRVLSKEGDYRWLLASGPPIFRSDGSFSGYISSCVDITEQVNAIKKTGEAEQKTRLAINSAALGVYEIIYETNEMITDDRFKKIWGFDKDAPREEYAAVMHPDDILVRNAAHDLSLTTGQVDYQARIIWKDNSIHWVRVTGTIIYGENKQPFKLIGVVQDINDNIISQRKIEESERNLRKIILQAPVAICIVRGPSYIVEIANNKMYELWGKPEKEILGKPIFEGLPEARDQGIEQLLQKVYGTNNSYVASERSVKLPRNGKMETVFVNFVYEPLAAGDNSFPGILCVAIDVTPQVIARQKIEEVVSVRTRELELLNESLKHSEERYHLMVEEVQDYAILYLNAGGTIENWNKGAEKIKGYKAEEIIGQHMSVFYTPEDRENHLPKILLKKAAENGRAVHEGWRVRKDGSYFWASVVITAVHNEANSVIGFSKVTHDLTEKKKADDKLRLNATELEIKNMELEKMNKELESFAYISSHDLQEPLRKIQVFSDQLLENEIDRLSDNGKDKFKRMRKAAERMQQLIGDLLAYSRTSSSERKFEVTDLAAIVEEVKEELKEELHQRNVTIEMTTMCQVKIIPFQFRQLMLNLVSNSLKFLRPQEPLQIKIISHTDTGQQLNDQLIPDSTYCHISVSDNGIGFEQKYSEQIFQVFQRLHGRNEFSGTGIGLAIVKKIVENHHGLIKATGIPGRGATFDIYIPV